MRTQFDCTAAKRFLPPPYFLIGKSSSPKICRISMMSPSAAGQFSMSSTSWSFDFASTIQ